MKLGPGARYNRLQHYAQNSGITLSDTIRAVQQENKVFREGVTVVQVMARMQWDYAEEMVRLEEAALSELGAKDGKA